MKFLEKLGLKKKKEQQELDVQPTQQPRLNRLNRIIKALNRPMSGAIGFNPTPKRTPMELQLGIPEYISPEERRPDFTPKMKQLQEIKEEKVDWRPLPNKPRKVRW